MARSTFLVVAVLLSGVAGAAGAEADARGRANPIRRVVDMLQLMSKKVKDEGVAEKDLFEKFMCYCTTGVNDLKLAISSAETKIPQVDSGLKEAEASYAQLGSDLAQHKQDRSDAQAALATATSLREKEAATFAKDSSDAKTNIAALGKAIGATESGAGGSFLQTNAAAALKQLTLTAEMSSVDRDVLASFLMQGQGYVPQSGQITGILKQLKDTMEADLAEITSAEQQAIANFQDLSAAKEKEIAAASAAIESKLQRHGQVGEEIVRLKEDLDDTQKQLLEDQKFLADLNKNCATKQAEWDERSRIRTEELLAIADTIKILNDDDALELFKKTLPSPSLLQTLASGKELKHQALKALGRNKDTRLSLIAMALRGGAKNFDKVLKMIDDMVKLLGEEQVSDDKKKAYCLAELDKAEDEQKVLEQTTADLEKAIEEAEDSIATLAEEIKALSNGIRALDKQVAEATEIRQTEHQEFTDTTASDNAAKELIGVAKNRMAKFYSPKSYKAPPKRELSAEERITVNMGGTLAATAAPGGIAGTGVTVLAQVAAHQQEEGAPGPAPETFGAYQSKGEESGGVLAMLDMMVADLDKEIQTITVDEKDAQAEYEQFMEDASNKRAADSNSVAEKEGAKADTSAALEKLNSEHKATVAETMAKAEQIKDLHLECDWLLSNFEARKAARAGEVDSLKKAKAVLSGADYALVQSASTRATRVLGGRS